MANNVDRQAYWKANLRIVIGLLSVWFLFSCVLSILGVEALNKFKLGGFPLGFWIAQQGAIYAFILIILAYAILMERLDKKFGQHEGGN